MPPSKFTVRILCTSIPIPTRNFIFSSAFFFFFSLWKIENGTIAASQFQMRWLIFKNHKVQSRSWSSLYHLIAKVIYRKSPAIIFFLYFYPVVCVKYAPIARTRPSRFFFPRLFWCAIDDAHCVCKFQLFFILTLNGRVKRIPSGRHDDDDALSSHHAFSPSSVYWLYKTGANEMA